MLRFHPRPSRNDDRAPGNPRPLDSGGTVGPRYSPSRSARSPPELSLVAFTGSRGTRGSCRRAGRGAHLLASPSSSPPVRRRSRGRRERGLAGASSRREPSGPERAGVAIGHYQWSHAARTPVNLRPADGARTIGMPSGCDPAGTRRLPGQPRSLTRLLLARTEQPTYRGRYLTYQY